MPIVVDKNGCVFIKSDVAAVGPSSFLSRSYYDATNYFALFYGGAGDGVLDGGNEDIPNGRVATSGASENADTQNFFRA